MTLTPWHDISTPWIVFAGYGTMESTVLSQATLRIDNPEIHATGRRTRDTDAISSFYKAVIAGWAAAH